ncbi:hypothetical protein TNCV_4739441 [Trichonephila clavipes]|nr:hypothetical protein TNCV_4739441 [Trichonephila clavipes]
MNEDRCRKKTFLANHMGNRPRGRLLLRWIDCVEKDLNILNIKTGKQLLKVEMSAENFWRRRGPTHDSGAIEEES